jgi:hypothetical protein
MISPKLHGLKLVVVVLALIALAFVPRVRAQQSSVFDGQLRLSEPVNWQGKMLPAGEYTFSVSSTNFPARLILHGPKTSVVILASGRSGGFPEQKSALTIELRGKTRYVRELSLNNPPVAFRYQVPALPKNESAQQAPTMELVTITRGAR